MCFDAAFYLQILSDNWKLIRDEGMKQIDSKTGSFVHEEENLLEKGQWMQFTLYARGKKIRWYVGSKQSPRLFAHYLAQ